MKGRKPAVHPDDVVEAVLQFKERIVIEDNGEKKIVVATDSVWTDLSIHLNGKMTKSAIHTFVYKGRNDIKVKLGFPSTTIKSIPVDIDLPIENNSSDTNCSSDEDFPTKSFVFTFSVDEWNQIKPQEVLYRLNDKNRPLKTCKTYYTLTKNQWSPILAEHFWAHTHGSNFVTVIARCSICRSHFKGIIAEQPLPNARVLMQCTYVGNFDELHQSNKKRRLIGPAKEKAVISIIDKNISSETYREKEATRLMRTGDHEPAILPSGNCLRTLKSKHLVNNRRHKDVLTSLAIMKNENEYKNIIHDIGYDPFFVYYNCAEQVHIYRSYSCTTENPKLVIDATGSVVKNFLKLGLVKTKFLYLYEALVYDRQKNQNFTVTNMISERHCNIAISNWLSKWTSTDVMKPKETVCDNSVALLSVIVKSFTQYSSLQHYVKVCADLLTNEIAQTSYLLPKCFVRIDVAHFIKICSRWTPIKSVPRRVKEIVLRSVGLLIKSQSILELRSLLLSMFVVFTNETDGICLQNGQETPCETHKKKILEATSCGIIEFEQQFNDAIALAESEDEARSLLDELYENQNEGLGNFENPFKEWADSIYNNSKSLVQEGSTINPLYIPDLVPILIKIMKFLPLWSGVMIPIFGYGDEISSSAAVESSFRKLKTVTFKHISLPTELEYFLETHITSLKGAALIRTPSNINVLSSPSVELNQVDYGNEHLSSSFNCTEQNQWPDKTLNIIENNNNDDEWPSLRFIEDNQKSPSALYVVTDTEVLINKESDYIQENEDCENPCIDDQESKARESWNRKSYKERKSNSYLVPNPQLRHLHISNLRNKQSLPILKNGSRFEELKSTKNKNRKEKIILSNTCAFDSLASLMMVSYCDSQLYANQINDLRQNSFFNFIISIVKNGITASTYSERVDIIMNHMNPQLQPIEYDTILAACDATIVTVIDALLKDFPTLQLSTICSSSCCSPIFPLSKVHLSYQTTDGKMRKLQEFLDNCITPEKSKCEYMLSDKLCEGIKEVISNISELYLFIDIFFWEGEENITKNRSSETTEQVKMKLCDIPQMLINNSVTYELRGVISFHPGKSKLRNTIGHYNAYARRGTGNWELFDDLKKKPIPTKASKTVPIETLIYTI